jgi:hypothetical protein
MRSVPSLAAGIASLPSTSSSYAATQAAWRFFNNDRIGLPALVEPLREAARDRVTQVRSPFVLLVHDWSKLACPHANKRDRVRLSHEHDVGYDLTTALLVSPDDGSPLAPMEIHLRTAEGVHSTRESASRHRPHLEQILPTMTASLAWHLPRPIVHVIDREADSVDHFRRWDRHKQHFLVRGDDRNVKWNGESLLLSTLRRRLRRKGQFRDVGPAEYRGQAARLWTVETDVVLYRPAKKSKNGQKYQKPGRPLTLRCVFVQVRDDADKVLADWILLTNTPREWATTEHLARCYYWRWRIESFFKLLKSHGQQMEQWLQESGIALARRLLVAAMACVVVWQLQADDSPQALEFKTILVRLSGRQTKRGRPHTAPALLAGLHSLLAMLALLEHYDLKQLKSLANQLPFLNTG